MSGYEAERQRNDIKQFGREVASKLAERRAEYAKRRMNQLQEESEIIEVRIIHLVLRSNYLQRIEFANAKFKCVCKINYKKTILNVLVLR